MRQLANYSFECAASDIESCPQMDELLKQVDCWLHSKGELDKDKGELTLRDGSKAMIRYTETSCSQGHLTEITLIQPTKGGRFHTKVNIAKTDDTLALSVRIAANLESLTPTRLDVHCPRLVRDIIAPPSSWHYRGTPLTSVPLEFSGESGGGKFIDLAWDRTRQVPIVAVSDDGGLVLHPDIVEAIAADLAGLCIVTRLDRTASWEITRRKGKEWSCYGGAIRLYWPNLNSDSYTRQHPLWTASRLLTSVGVIDSETAAKRIRNQLRKLILDQSTFSIVDSLTFSVILHAAKEENLAVLKTEAIESSDYKKLADEYSCELDSANSRVDVLEETVRELKNKISSLQYQLRSKNNDEYDEVQPVTETPPSTVEEAVSTAKDKFDDHLIWSSSVEEGIKTVAQDAGPPDKILAFLSELVEFTKAKRQGSLGDIAINWFKNRGIEASGETETIRNSTKEQKARTWGDGSGGKRIFELHLKPSDATAPDRCVRIYFDYAEEKKKTIVGWVGAHPIRK